MRIAAMGLESHEEPMSGILWMGLSSVSHNPTVSSRGSIAFIIKRMTRTITLTLRCPLHFPKVDHQFTPSPYVWRQTQSV